MTELEMIKAFAELEGVDFVECRGKLWIKDERGTISINGYGHKEYNPLKDWELTFKAMVDYDVQKSQSMVNTEKTLISIRGSEHVVSVFIKKEIPHAIIECILKSKGLWNA